MKISLAWVFDYIDYPYSKVDVDKIVHLFNTRTAEIEHYEKYSFNMSSCFIGQVVNISDKSVEIFCKELDSTINFSARTDITKDSYYLFFQDADSYRWATLTDFSIDKDGLFPAISLSDDGLSGSWRDLIQSNDYILDVDNKSINHRPDLWGHYGIAREVATFLQLPLKPLDSVLSKQKVFESKNNVAKDSKSSISIEIQDEDGCFRFAGISCKGVVHKASDLFTAIRLAKVGAKPINAMVDLTNYVMFDLGHPMHVFDKNAVTDKVIVRKAEQDETLTILDGQQLELRSVDLVVASTKQPLALAGIMGGLDSGFSDTTKEIFLEAAGFDPTMIRQTAHHFKLRTEACTRFEKYIDPMQNVTVLQRFLYLAFSHGLIASAEESILSAGITVKPLEIAIDHTLLERRLGVSIDTNFVQNTLEALNFGISLEGDKQSPNYKVVVPTNRMTKDIGIQEDIVEEIIRMYGYENLAYELPKKESVGFSYNKVQNSSYIKRFFAHSMRMHEVRDYLFYDESFIRNLALEDTAMVSVKNSVSQNWQRLVTSLIPHLLKNVVLNLTKKDHLRFFEWNNIWSQANKKINEQSSLAGMVYDKKSVDFYEVKQQLQGLWDLLKINVVWQKATGAIPVWYDKHKTAQLFVGGKSIGFAGMMSQAFMSKALQQGEGFVFELNAEFLSSQSFVHQAFTSWSKYQSVAHDISMLVPLHVSADEIKNTVLGASNLITKVDLVDYFEKDDWDNQRSLTFRYEMSDHTKTLEKAEIDAVVQQVQKSLEKYDVQVR